MGIKVNQNLQKEKKKNSHLCFCIRDDNGLINVTYIEILAYYKLKNEAWMSKINHFLEQYQ